MLLRFPKDPPAPMIVHIIKVSYEDMYKKSCSFPCPYVSGSVLSDLRDPLREESYLPLRIFCQYLLAYYSTTTSWTKGVFALEPPVVNSTRTSNDPVRFCVKSNTIFVNAPSVDKSRVPTKSHVPPYDVRYFTFTPSPVCNARANRTVILLVTIGSYCDPT